MLPCGKLDAIATLPVDSPIGTVPTERDRQLAKKPFIRNEVAKHAALARMSDTRIGGWILNRPYFSSNHHRAIDLSQKACPLH
ncbi:hypothetical protein HYPDE_38788 [Hyphomicrobium denitrificans 1NES1]|uniref:Uncharacterized protein n=1 Tax=Hyphomicrobium denitrificans 1NES1 TaxID=670307 RepID=N0BB12_9HYPH|nr:hypothetical protein HYPDE_38788 [Hyphomicrobium denitrificans 1NES1]